MPNVHELIRDHVTLSIRCLDRLYLHAYMPKLETSGGLCYFLRDYLGHPIPSPALFKPMHDRFVTAVEEFVTRRTIPVVHCESGQDKDAISPRSLHGPRASSCSASPRRRCARSKPINSPGPGVKVRDGPPRRVRSPPRDQSARSQSHAGLRSADARVTLLRSCHPRKSRPRAT